MGAERQALSDHSARSTLASDLEGCICPQDYVKSRCPVHDPEGTYYAAERAEGARCQHCPKPTLADERSFMCTDCASKADEEAQDLRDQVEHYRTVIKAALDTMAVANDTQLGPGGVARKAYAGLWHAYFAIPAGIESPPASDEEDRSDA